MLRHQLIPIHDVIPHRPGAHSRSHEPVRHLSLGRVAFDHQWIGGQVLQERGHRGVDSRAAIHSERFAAIRPSFEDNARGQPDAHRLPLAILEHTLLVIIGRDGVQIEIPAAG